MSDYEVGIGQIDTDLAIFLNICLILLPKYYKVTVFTTTTMIRSPESKVIGYVHQN